MAGEALAARLEGRAARGGKDFLFFHAQAFNKTFHPVDNLFKTLWKTWGVRPNNLPHTPFTHNFINSPTIVINKFSTSFPPISFGNTTTLHPLLSMYLCCFNKLIHICTPPPTTT